MHKESTTGTSTAEPAIIRTSIKLDPRVHAAGKQLAKEDRRDFQAWVEVQIELKWREKHGEKPFPSQAEEVVA